MSHLFRLDQQDHASALQQVADKLCDQQNEWVALHYDPAAGVAGPIVMIGEQDAAPVIPLHLAPLSLVVDASELASALNDSVPITFALYGDETNVLYAEYGDGKRWRIPLMSPLAFGRPKDANGEHRPRFMALVKDSAQQYGAPKYAFAGRNVLVHARGRIHTVTIDQIVEELWRTDAPV